MISELQQEIERLLRSRLIGREWAKTLFWKLLEFNRINSPILHELTKNGIHELLNDAVLWAENNGVYVVICGCVQNTLTTDTEHAIALAVNRIWRSTVLIFENATATSWDIVVCIPRNSGNSTSCSYIGTIRQCYTNQSIAKKLYILSPESNLNFQRSMRELFQSGQSINDFIKEIMHGFPRWLVDQLSGGFFEVFLAQAAGHIYLTKSEEYNLGKKIQAGDRSAWEKLVLSNIRLSIWGAKRFASREIEFDDLLQHAIFALMRAAEKYNPHLGFRFSTYATTAINKGCNRFKLKEYGKLKQFQKYQNLTHHMYTDKSSDTNVNEQDTCSDRITHMIELLNELSSRDRNIIYRRFGIESNEKETLQQIGDSIGLGKERIRQIEFKCLSWLQREALIRWPDLFDEISLNSTPSYSVVSSSKASSEKTNIYIRSIIFAHPKGIGSVDLALLSGLNRTKRKTALSFLLKSGEIIIEGCGRSAVYRPSLTDANNQSLKVDKLDMETEKKKQEKAKYLREQEAYKDAVEKYYVKAQNVPEGEMNEL